MPFEQNSYPAMIEYSFGNREIMSWGETEVMFYRQAAYGWQIFSVIWMCKEVEGKNGMAERQAAQLTAGTRVLTAS